MYRPLIPTVDGLIALKAIVGGAVAPYFEHMVRTGKFHRPKLNGDNMDGEIAPH